MTIESSVDLQYKDRMLDLKYETLQENLYTQELTLQEHKDILKTIKVENEKLKQKLTDCEHYKKVQKKTILELESKLE